MKLTMLDGEPENKTCHKPGQRGYLRSAENPLTIIGEDDLYVWSILDSGPYYGIRKQPGNLAELHTHNAPIYRRRIDCRVRPERKYMKCGDCKNAVFERTPTGRIKTKTAGHCGMSKELKAHYAHNKVAPCVVINQPHITCVWPYYDATYCPMYVPN